MLGDSEISASGGAAVIPDRPGPPTYLKVVESIAIDDQNYKVALTWNPPANIVDS